MDSTRARNLNLSVATRVITVISKAQHTLAPTSRVMFNKQPRRIKLK